MKRIVMGLAAAALAVGTLTAFGGGTTTTGAYKVMILHQCISVDGSC